MLSSSPSSFVEYPHPSASGFGYRCCAFHLPPPCTLPFNLIMAVVEHSFPLPFQKEEAAGKSQTLPLLLDATALETSSKILHVIRRYRMRKEEITSDESTLKQSWTTFTPPAARLP